MGLVIDASAAIAWTFEDEHTTAILSLAARVADEGASVATHFKVEYANAMVMAVRRGRATHAKAHAALVSIDGLDLKIDDLAARVASGGIVELARKHKLTAYDAAHLKLAIRLEASFATLDQDLAAAARRERVQLIDLGVV